ncbi:hypothetical protein ACIQBJ_33810 [Kitasatospora sp. NPDC088391]|uniref:hypothetical protein n=1 Tax=Kitasatospora sp. NPDC088391 TaxID=3364074 RepID=UPI00381B2405
MEQQPVEVRATEGSFGVLDAGAVQGEPADYSTGLVITMPTGARVHTGINTGPVRITATALPRRPAPPTDTHDWDEVVEASAHAPRGLLRVESLDEGPVAGLPPLSPDGPGWYRLLVLARGRDTAHDAAVDRPTEDYAITAWPEPPSPPRLLKTADECGRTLRLAASRRPAPPPALALPDAGEEDRQAALRAARLQAMGTPQQPTGDR